MVHTKNEALIKINETIELLDKAEYSLTMLGTMNMRDFLLMIKEKGEYPKKENESPEINSILSEAKTKQYIKETKNNSYELDVFGYDFLEKEDRKNVQKRPLYSQTVVHGDYIRNSVLRDFKPINNTNKEDKLDIKNRGFIVKFWEYISNNKLLSTIIGGTIVAIIITTLKAYKII